MTGRIVYVPAEDSRHSDDGCPDMPAPEQYEPGTRWACNDCNRVFVMVRGSQYNEYYEVWRKLSERNKGGKDL